MVYTTEEYADALLRLSSSARWPEARTDLLKTISSDQLGDIVVHCMHTNLSREELEKALCNLLDSIAKKRKVAQGVPTITEAGGAELNSELPQGYGNDENASSTGSQIFDEQPSATSTPRTTYTPAQLTAASPTHIGTETEHASGDTAARVHSPEHAEAENDRSDNPLRDLWLSRDVVPHLTAKLRLRVQVRTCGNGYRWLLRSIDDDPSLKQALCEKYQSNSLTLPDMVTRCARATFERGEMGRMSEPTSQPHFG